LLHIGTRAATVATANEDMYIYTYVLYNLDKNDDDNDNDLR